MKTIAKKSAKSATASKSAGSAPSTPSSTSSAPPAATPTLDAGVVAQCVSLLGQIDALIGPVTPLSSADMRRALKLRKGGAQVITQVADLCTHHGIPAVGPVTVQGMSEQMARATTLNEIAVPMGIVQKKVSDAAFSAESSSWQSATAFYTMLLRLAVVDPALAVGLQPVEAFFQTKRTKGTQRKTTANANLRKAIAIAAKHAEPATGPAAPVATPNGTGAPAAATQNGSNGAAPAAPVATGASVTPAPGGAAHS